MRDDVRLSPVEARAAFVGRSAPAWWLTLVLLAPGVAHADSPASARVPPPVVLRMTEPEASRVVEPPPRRATFTDIHGVGSFAQFFAGAITGLLAHEGGHLVANLAYGNVPKLTLITYAHAVPFVVIDAQLRRSPDDRYHKRDGSLFRGGRHGYYVINTAGFQAQNLGSELLLTLRPDLRHQDSPYAKGYLLLNIGLSVGYATAALLHVEDIHGDIHGASERGPYSHEVLALTTMAPAVIDLARYLWPDNRVLPWLSRGSKALFLGMDIDW